MLAQSYHIGADFTSRSVHQFALLVLIEFLSGQLGVASIWFNDAMLWCVQHTAAVIIPEGAAQASR